MILHNSWQSHLNAKNSCDAANRNLGAFVKALGNVKTKNDKINALMEDPDSIIVVVNNRCQVKFIHSCKKFDATCTISTVSIGGLVGSGPRASPIIIKVDVATTATEVKIPPTKRIWRCNNTKELDELQTNGEAATERTSKLRRSARNGRPTTSINKTTEPTKESTTADASEDEGTSQTYIETAVKIPAPFLAIAALECGSSNPLDIIISIKRASNDFDNAHKNATDFNYDEMQARGEDFANWLYAVHQKQVQETRLSVEPDNIELGSIRRNATEAASSLPSTHLAATQALGRATTSFAN